MNIGILTIGDELLIGQVTDTNSAWIAKQLNLIGVQLSEIRTVEDDTEQISNTIVNMFGRYNFIITTGGLGPTKDDITKKALVKVFNDELIFNQDMYNTLSDLYKKRGRKMTEAHIEMCHLPAKAQLFENKMGTAPGIVLISENKTLISLPGVPYEMKYIMKHGVIPFIQNTFSQEYFILHKTILTAGVGETSLNMKFSDIEESLPDHIKIAFLPGLCRVRIRLSAQGNDLNILQSEIDHFSVLIVERIKEHVYGFDDITLEEVIAQTCRKQGMKLAIAESCTGGLIAHKITSVAGASHYFIGSIVVYSNLWKEKLLGVPKETLDNFGAVSEETARAMLKGLLHKYDTNLGIAVTGIAGPGGATPGKPVGTIWVACGNERKQVVQKLQLTRDRKHNIEYSSSFALNMLRKFLMEQ